MVAVIRQLDSLKHIITYAVPISVIFCSSLLVLLITIAASPENEQQSVLRLQNSNKLPISVKIYHSISCKHAKLMW